MGWTESGGLGIDGAADVPVLGADVEEGRVAAGFWLVAMVVGVSCRLKVRNNASFQVHVSRFFSL